MKVPNENQIGTVVIHSAIRIHQELGPGLLEAAYQTCLAFELHQQGLSVEKEVPLPVIYKQIKRQLKDYRMFIWHRY
jgi:GxxExxY protein